MQRTPKKTEKVIIHSVNSAKRKISATSPDRMSNFNMSAAELRSIIQDSIAPLLDDKLKHVATKTDVEQITVQIAGLSAQVNALTEENQALKERVKSLETDKERDHQELMRMVDQTKRKNLIFKGLEKQTSAKEAVKSVCKDILGIQHINVRFARIIFERNGKMGVIAELATDENADDVLKNTKKLAGSSISVEKDLSADRQRNKKVMLQLRKDIMAIDQTHKVLVRNDKMKIGNNWFIWNSNKELLSGHEKGESVIKSLYGDKLNSLVLVYNEIIKKLDTNYINSKN